MSPEKKQLQLIESFAMAAIASVALVVVLTITGDLWPPLKNWLKATFYHHWLGKGVLAIAIFVILGMLLKGRTKGELTETEKWLRYLGYALLLGSLVLIAFYYYESFLVHHE